MAGIAIRGVGQNDLVDLQSLIERCADYYELVAGHPPGPAEAHSVYTVLPEGKKYADKFVLLARSSTLGLIGAIDIVRDWPRSGAWIIGLLLLVPEARGRGLGRLIVASLEQQARESGALNMRVAVVRVNEQALGFWSHLGYKRLAEDDLGADPVRLVKPLT